MKLVTKWREMFFTWVDAKLPTAKEIQLRQKNIYILPTRYGWLMLAIIFLILIAATNYQNNMGFMAGFVILAVGILSTFYTYRNLRYLKISTFEPESKFVGEDVIFNLEITNATMQYRSSIGIGENKNNVKLLDVKEESFTNYSKKFKANKRGLYIPPRLVITSIFPFGIFQAWSWFKLPYKVLIYPKPILPPTPLKNSFIGDEEGENAIKGSEDFYNVKEYQVGDPLNQVMWKAFARERGVLIKEFEDKIGEQYIFDWNSVVHYEKEIALSYLCYELVNAEKKGVDFGLKLPKQSIEVSSGKKHLFRCLEALALF